MAECGSYGRIHKAISQRNTKIDNFAFRVSGHTTTTATAAKGHLPFSPGEREKGSFPYWCRCHRMMKRSSLLLCLSFISFI